MQLTRRLAWLVQREEIFACWSAAECVHSVLPRKLLSDLAARAGSLVRTWIADEVLRPLLGAWLSAPGRRLPSEVSRAIVQTLAPFLYDQDNDVHKAIAEYLGRVGSSQEAAIQALLTALSDQDQDVQVRWTAGVNLQAVVRGHKAAIPALLKALNDENALVQKLAYQSLLQATSEQKAHKAPRDSLLS